MFYDLNEYTENSTGVDAFILSGKRYELGEVSELTKYSISSIDTSSDLISQIRPIVDMEMEKWNEDIHKLSDQEVEAVYRLIISKINV